MKTRDFHLPGRSPAYAREGMAATSHPLASLAAIETLKAGGTAADAAVAAVAVLCVVEPHDDRHRRRLLLPDREARTAAVWGYNGSGRAAAAATAEKLIAQGMSRRSLRPRRTPSRCRARWRLGKQILKAHGRFGLDRALQPAIGYAEDGFPVAPRVASDWAKLRRQAQAARGRGQILPAERRRAGDRRHRAAAGACRDAEGDRPGGARPSTKGRLPTTSRDRAGCGRLSRGRRPRASSRRCGRRRSRTNYRGLDIVELPPNGQGMTALMLLNILEQFDFTELDAIGPERLHLLLEAARLAYGVRDAHLADPAHMRQPVPGLLDKGFAKKLAALIDPGRRVPLPKAPTPGSDTVYLTVVDRDRMAVSFINSLYAPFGTGIATEKTGIMLHNRGAGFVVEPGHPNARAGQAPDAHHHSGARDARRTLRRCRSA